MTLATTLATTLVKLLGKSLRQRASARRLLRCACCLLASLLCGPAALVTAAWSQTASHDARTLHVAAAADLEPLLPTLLQGFTQQTGVQVLATYGSSATLTQQILNGAPFDLFLAADMSYPQKVIDDGLGTSPKPFAYARGTLVLWARRDAPVLHGAGLSFAVLRNPALQSVAIANPDHAPYGRAAKAAIAGLHLDSTLAPKLRLAENIAQAAQYADSGNAEVGFLSLTSASTPRLQTDGTFLPVPPALYAPIVQGAVVLRHGPDAADAARLLGYLAQPATRAVLAKSGLQPPR